MNIADPQSFNRYSYVVNQPTNYIDPTGLMMMECGWRYVVPETCVNVEGEGMECGFDLQHAGLAYICTMTNSGGGGHQGPSLQPPTINPRKKKNQSADPCIDKKGPLDFSKNMQSHIFPRHIASSMWPTKSKYTFWPWQRTRSAYESQVASFSQDTFVNGRVAVSGDNVVYTYAFWGIDLGVAGAFREVGIDGLSRQATNVNTVIVSKDDCMSFITAHPGLPSQFTRYDIPGAMFGTGISTQHPSQF